MRTNIKVHLVSGIVIAALAVVLTMLGAFGSVADARHACESKGGTWTQQYGCR